MDAALARPERAVRLLGVVVLVVALLTGMFWACSGHYDRTALARTAATVAGDRAVGELLSYDYRTIDHKVDDTKAMLTGLFRDDYDRLMSDTVAPTARDHQISVQTEVLNTSVVSSSPDQVVLLVFVDQQSEALLAPTAAPVMTSSRLQVTLRHQQEQWLVSGITPV